MQVSKVMTTMSVSYVFVLVDGKTPLVKVAEGQDQCRQCRHKEHTAASIRASSG